MASSPTRGPSSPRGAPTGALSPRFEAPPPTTRGAHGLTWENTYITKPEGYEKFVKFNRSEVSAIIQQKLRNRLEGTEYAAETAAALANELSTAIKDGVKATGLQRYKLCVHVTLGQRGGQAMRCASRCLWDTTTDNFVSEGYENDTLFATCQVYGLFHE